MIIRELLKTKGKTAKEVAFQTGMSEANLSAIIKGKANPSLNTLIKIANALGVGVRDLFESSSQMDSDNFHVYLNLNNKDYVPKDIREVLKAFLENNSSLCGVACWEVGYDYAKGVLISNGQTGKGLDAINEFIKTHSKDFT